MRFIGPTRVLDDKLEDMRFSHASLVVALGLLACTGQKSRPDPGPTNHGSGVGGGQSTGGATTTGGASSVGGAGGTASNGGASTAGGGGMGGTGGGGVAHPASEIYPYCGCIADQSIVSSCSVCWGVESNPTSGACKDQVAACYTAGNNCGPMLDAVKSCPSLNSLCFDAVQQQHPESWDDVVATAKCLCEACPAPGECDSLKCQ